MNEGIKALRGILIHVSIGTYSATGPADNEPMKLQGAPSSDNTVQEFEAFPPRCQRCDKHLQVERPMTSLHH